MAISELPPDQISIDHVFGVIVASESRHRIVWTAGRVLKEDGSLHRVATGDPDRRRAVMRRLRSHLKALVERGELEERGVQFNYGADHEVSYDFVGEMRRDNEMLDSDPMMASLSSEMKIAEPQR